MIGRLNGVQGSLGGLGTISRLGNGNRLNLRPLAASRPTRGSGSMRATSCGIWAFGPSIAGSPPFKRHSRRPACTVGMTFRVVLEHDPETDAHSAVCPELPGCASDGETEEEARANIREALELYLAPGDLELPGNAKLVEVTVG